LGEAAQRFERRAESIATRLERQLEATASFHDLSKRQLLASHRSVLKLTRGGSVPTPQEFWEQTAQPQARNMFDAAQAAIDGEAGELNKALQQLATAIRLDIRANAGSIDEDWPIDELCEVAYRGIRRLVLTVRILNEIDELGRWWQGRLRRKATFSVAFRVLTSPLRHFELIVSTAEMALLERPPWSHDDRLLSAFELAHGELREYAMNLEQQLQRRARSMIDTVATEDLIDGSDRVAAVSETTAETQPDDERDKSGPLASTEPVPESTGTIELR
jgi:hypothetical protein